jgi:hypothetical protein
MVLGCEKTKYVTVGDAPAIPLGVSSVTHDGYITIYWNANNDNGLTKGYGVYRYTGTQGNQDQYVLLDKVDVGDNTAETYSYDDHTAENGSTYYYAVDAYNDFGESDLSNPDVFDTPRPEGSAQVYDYHETPGSAGFDFSRARVVAFDDGTADIHFEYDTDFNTYFLEASQGADFMDFGATSSINDVGWGDPGGGTGWSTIGYTELIVGHSYIVWTSDNHYATFRVEAFSTGSTHYVSIDWAYQPSDNGDNRKELKPRPTTRPVHAANYGRRDGK